MTPMAPPGLSVEAAALWRDIGAEFMVDDAAGLRLLRTACEALDAMRRAEAQVERDGPTYRDRYGGIKAHPLLAVVRDNRAAMLLALRQLGLDPNPKPQARIGRPPGSKRA